jgi:hypothetical protein
MCTLLGADDVLATRAYRVCHVPAHVLLEYRASRIRSGQSNDLVHGSAVLSQQQTRADKI